MLWTMASIATCSPIPTIWAWAMFMISRPHHVRISIRTMAMRPASQVILAPAVRNETEIAQMISASSCTSVRIEISLMYST
ncbi:hypothetical protein Kisp02_23090 [Kineosporia sp. NBRC 101731]|nr:hypothetical protein Kisp02_23090 [Kineosporia sp. NBRC 101731]